PLFQRRFRGGPAPGSSSPFREVNPEDDGERYGSNFSGGNRYKSNPGPRQPRTSGTNNSPTFQQVPAVSVTPLNGLTPATGIPATGIPATGIPATSIPVSGQPLFDGPVDQQAAELLAATMLVDDGAAPRLGMALGSLAGQSMVVSHLPVAAGIGQTVTLVDSDGQQMPGQIMAMPGDWALVGVQGLASTGLPVATEAPSIGDMIYAVSGRLTNRGLEPQISRGIVSGHCPGTASDGSALYQVDLAVGRMAMLGQQAGEAGGALVDASGNLLGLAVAAETGDHDPALSCMRTLAPHGTPHATANGRAPPQSGSLAAR
ncbi:MAG: trypsin-like peptidase domain-containing protein, partial [Pseudomonadota bacterium]